MQPFAPEIGLRRQVPSLAQGFPFLEALAAGEDPDQPKYNGVVLMASPAFASSGLTLRPMWAGSIRQR